jgi:hypothetical protein
MMYALDIAKIEMFVLYMAKLYKVNFDQNLYATHIRNEY